MQFHTVQYSRPNIWLLILAHLVKLERGHLRTKKQSLYVVIHFVIVSRLAHINLLNIPAPPECIVNMAIWRLCPCKLHIHDWIVLQETNGKVLMSWCSYAGQEVSQMYPKACTNWKPDRQIENHVYLPLCARCWLGFGVWAGQQRAAWDGKGRERAEQGIYEQGQVGEGKTNGLTRPRGSKPYHKTHTQQPSIALGCFHLCQRFHRHVIE